MNEKIKVDKRVSKSFCYSKGITNLSFTLRIDTKEELENFLALLKIALRDVKEQLNKK